MMEPKRRARLEATFETHNFLWHDFEDVWKLLRGRDETERGLYTAALVLLCCCLEAHANFLGERAYPKEWANIRERLRAAQRRGAVGRVDILAGLLGVDIDRSRDPYSALVELEKRRHKFVHPELEIINEVVEYRNACELEPPESEYYDLASPEFLLRARGAVEAVTAMLHETAFEKHPHVIFGRLPFSGVLGLRGVSIES